MKITSLFLLLATMPSQAAVVWQPAPNVLASASWDNWSYAPPTGQIGTGSQGSAQEISGALITSSDLETAVMDSYEFPGGLGFNPDTYYFHTGGGSWRASLELAESVTYVRVSYSLLGFGGSPAEDFPVIPRIEGATSLGGGRYATDDGLILGNIYYHDFVLGSPQNVVETTFGDDIFPGFEGSFRSVDGVQLEVFRSAPIPEPSTGLLALIGIGMVWLRRR